MSSAVAAEVQSSQFTVQGPVVSVEQVDHKAGHFHVIHSPQEKSAWPAIVLRDPEEAQLICETLNGLPIDLAHKLIEGVLRADHHKRRQVFYPDIPFS